MKQPLDRMASLFQALGDPTRLRILGLLLTGEVCVCHIHESLRIPQPKASRHLAYLRRSGLVDTRRDGLWVYYRLIDAVRSRRRHHPARRHRRPRPPRERPQGYEPVSRRKSGAPYRVPPLSFLPRSQADSRGAGEACRRSTTPNARKSIRAVAPPATSQAGLIE